MKVTYRKRWIELVLVTAMFVWSMLLLIENDRSIFYKDRLGAAILFNILWFAIIIYRNFLAPKFDFANNGIVNKVTGNTIVSYNNIKGLSQWGSTLTILTNKNESLKFRRAYIENYDEVKKYMSHSLKLPSIASKYSFSTPIILLNVLMLLIALHFIFLWMKLY